MRPSACAPSRLRSGRRYDALSPPERTRRALCGILIEFDEEYSIAAEAVVKTLDNNAARPIDHAVQMYFAESGTC